MKITIVILTLFLTQLCFGQKKPSLIGDWKATNQTKSFSDLIDFLTLNISKDYKVRFRQALFESPISFHFEGQILKDKIFYKIDTYSHFEEEGTKFIGTETHTFKINTIQDNCLSITDLKNNITIEYIKQ